MNAPHLSRRSFVKTALGAAAASAIPHLDLALGAKPLGHRHSLADAGLTFQSLSEVSQLVRNKKVSPVELAQACLARIEQLNPGLNAFITVTAESALAEARQAEVEIASGNWRGPLHGIPIALKDLVDTAGVRTTAASGLFKDRVPTEDAELVRRLKLAGAVLLGKTNMHEFAYGGSSVISFFGPVRNPWQPAYSIGGSSAGSAAAVAAGLCYAAIGSDTGGSIRQPSGFAGIVGIKPTYGRVSTRGVIPLSWYLDHVGPMTRTVHDAALMLQVIAGYDPQDATTTDLPVPDYLANLASGAASLRLGIPRAYFYDDLHPEIQAAVESALSVLKKLTASQRDFPPLASGPSYASLMDPTRTVLIAEAYAYHQDYVAKSPDLYHPETLKRIRAGADVSAPAYILARRQLDSFRRASPQTFDSVDLLITPTAPVPPFTIAELLADLSTLRAKEILMLRNTRPFNALGLPTISVPCGFTTTGLPFGMQITGPPGSELTVLRLAYAYERETQWHTRHPATQS
ncbi:MAG TPA: amidase [Candidatus Acidoferrales bacterium]|nr:amidase [Candidatus Acidoferrales bacterium]